MQSFTDYMESRGSKKNYDYSSVIYLLPDSTGKKIYDWGLRNIKDDDIFKDPEDPTFGREDEIHCTVVYGIHDKRSTSVRDILANCRPFEITLGKISAFSSEVFDVLKIDVSSKELHDLHKLICDKVEVTKTHPEYKPHVTLAYMKKGLSKPYIDLNEFEGISVEVDKVVFSSSAGFKTPLSLKK